MKIVILGRKNSYYVRTLIEWLNEIKDIIEENIGGKVEFSTKDVNIDIPIILVNGKRVFEGLPDNEGTLIELILSNI